jgi:formyl-CoA transferase
VTLLGCPIRLSESPAVVERAPLLGEHTAAVLAAELGCSDEAVARLREAGVV